MQKEIKFTATQAAHQEMIDAAKSCLIKAFEAQKGVEFDQFDASQVIECAEKLKRIEGFSAKDVLTALENISRTVSDDARDARMARSSWAGAAEDSAEAAYNKYMAVKEEIDAATVQLGL